MNKGYMWFAQNNDKTDYIKLSVELAKSIKSHNKENLVCIITDKKSLPTNKKWFDVIKILKHDDSKDMKWKMANEHRAFSYTPFTHTIKLEADMLFTQSTDWWWDILCQHDMVFSYNCLNYKDEIIKQTPYRKLFEQNSLPNIYNGLTYFRRSKRAQEFYDICQNLTLNWQETKNKFLINCHDEEPTTDIIYSLALKIQDPLQENKIDYAWFKFIHGKPFINKIPGNMEQYNYLYPYKINKKTYLGGKSIDRIWHYHDKNMIDTLYDRVF